MEAWIDRLARALGEEPLSRMEANELLGVARDVAHRVERKITPLSTFVLGVAAGRATTGGAARAEALPGLIERLRAELPEAPPQNED